MRAGLVPEGWGAFFPGETVAGKQGEPGAEGVRSRHPGKCVFIPNVEKEILVLNQNPYCAKEACLGDRKQNPHTVPWRPLDVDAGFPGRPGSAFPRASTEWEG